MPDCDYCSESFDDEDTYLKHLKKTHEKELSSIDRRRVEGTSVDTGSSLNIGMIIIVAVTVVGFAMVGFLIFADGGDGEPQGETHEHGTMSVMIDGDPVNLAQPQYTEQDGHFHFHGSGDDIGDGRFVWHTHSHGVTLEYAIESLGMAIGDGGERVTIDGETYDDADADTAVSILVDGESVDPSDHELDGVLPIDDAEDGAGDDIQIEIETDETE